MKSLFVQRIESILPSQENSPRKEPRKNSEAPLNYSIENAINQIERYGLLGEEAVRKDTITYITEQVWEQLLSSYHYYLYVNGKDHGYLASPDSATPDAPVIDSFKRAVIQRLERNIPAPRESAEVEGFKKLEERCNKAEKDQRPFVFFWLSPPGPRADGYSDTGRTFFGMYHPQNHDLETYSLTDIFTPEDRVALWNDFRSESQMNLNLPTQPQDTDFLSQPLFATVYTDKVSAQTVLHYIDSYLHNKYHQPFTLGRPIEPNQRYEIHWQTNPELEQIFPLLEPHINHFISLLKESAPLDLLNRTFRGLEVIALQYHKDYQTNPDSFNPVVISPIEATENFGLFDTVVRFISCPVVGGLIPDPERPYAYLNMNVGPTDDFYCEKCGYKIKFGAGQTTCPQCGAKAECGQ